MPIIAKPRALVWTAHSRSKLRQHGLSASRVVRVIRVPKRVEEGIAPETIALMQSAGSTKHPYEIWVMVQETKEQEQRITKIISAWKYPGVTKPGDPIPESIRQEMLMLL